MFLYKYSILQRFFCFVNSVSSLFSAQYISESVLFPIPLHGSALKAPLPSDSVCKAPQFPVEKMADTEYTGEEHRSVIGMNSRTGTEKNTMRRMLLNALIVILTGIMAYSGYQLWTILFQRHDTRHLTHDIISFG